MGNKFPGYNNLPPPEIIRGMVSWFTLTLGIKPLYFAWNYANSIMGRIIEVAINVFSSSRSFASSLNAVKSPVTTTLSRSIPFHTISTPYSVPVMASSFRSSFRNSPNNSREVSAHALKLVFASSSSISSLLGTPNRFTVAQFLSK